MRGCRALPQISMEALSLIAVALTIIRKLAADVVRCSQCVKYLQVLACHVKIAKSQVLEPGYQQELSDTSSYLTVMISS